MHWISIKDQKPPTENPLHFYCEDGSQEIGWYNEDCDHWDVGGWVNCFYCGGKSPLLLIKHAWCKENKIITHWMRLPAPPEN